MNKQNVDARVQAAIENRQAGRTVEDDAGIELKADWPEPTSKARQLAGAANALRGEPLIYVVGVADKSGAITTPTQTEPHEWYARMRKAFDQLAPELMWVQTVFIGEGAESVLALVFDTSDFPYVINDGNRREVPLRVASGTESAHRNQIVRMFEPTIRPPAMAITEARLMARWYAQASSSAAVAAGYPADTSVSSLELELSAAVLVEHLGAQPTTLPIREMRTRILIHEQSIPLEVEVPRFGEQRFPYFADFGPPTPSPTSPPQHGVYALGQHIIATAPGEFDMGAFAYLTKPVGDGSHAVLRADLATAEQVRWSVALRVTGTDSPTRLAVTLTRTEPPGSTQAADGQAAAGDGQLGVWTLATQESDPWGA